MAQNRWHNTRKVMKICLVSMILKDSDFSWPWAGGFGKLISLYFHAYVEYPNQRLDASCASFWRWGGPRLRVRFKVKLLNSELVCSPPLCERLLGSPSPPWCPVFPPWFTHWFLIIIKSLGSNRFSISLLEEHWNEFTWWFSYYAYDLVIGPCISMGGMVLSNVVMSSSCPTYVEPPPTTAIAASGSVLGNVVAPPRPLPSTITGSVASPYRPHLPPPSIMPCPPLTTLTRHSCC
jgi:hypothetical protein